MNINDNTTNTLPARQFAIPSEEGDVAVGSAMTVSGLFWWEKGTNFFLEAWHNNDSGSLAINQASLAVLRLTGHLTGAATGNYTRFGVIDLGALATFASVGYQSHAGKPALSASAALSSAGYIRDGKAAISASATVAVAGVIV